MEVRKRAAKNLGKMSFAEADLQRLLYAHGDVKNPLPDTVKVLDEILTDFIQGIAFEAARVAQHSGRQKIKLDDFQFIFRKNPVFLGKLQETFEKKHAIDTARKLFNDDDEALKETAVDEAAADKASQAPSQGRRLGGGSTAGGSRVGAADEDLGVADDDLDADVDMITR